MKSRLEETVQALEINDEKLMDLHTDGVLEGCYSHGLRGTPLSAFSFSFSFCLKKKNIF